jgi:alanine dehydrogenase
VVVADAALRSMRRGAVVVDCAIDQGGSVEGIRETTHADPVVEHDGVLLYAVGNIPGAVPHTSTYALTNATLPYVVTLATRGVADAVRDDAELASGVNTVSGHVTNTAVAAALGKDAAALDAVLPGSNGVDR